MAVFASDTFTGADSTDLVAHDGGWTEHGSYASGQMTLLSNRAVVTNGNSSRYYRDELPAGANYEVEADLYFAENDGNNWNAGVMARADPTANTAYWFHYFGFSTDSWQLHKYVAGTYTQLGSNVPETIAAGSTRNCRIQVNGTTIKGFVDDVEVISVTDSSIAAAGRAAIHINPNSVSSSGGIHIDNFSADDALSGGGGGGVPIKAFRIIHG